MIREAETSDIPALHSIRMSVRENILNNPMLVSNEDYRRFLTTEGKGWLFVSENTIAGFAVLDLKKNNVWALFVHPDFEGKGIGRQLHDTMMDWFFQQNGRSVWLTTAPGTRAESFYRKAGWKDAGLTEQGEIKFEMTKAEWESF